MQTIRTFFLLCLAAFAGLSSRAQDQTIILDYIDEYKEMAIAEMQRTGVPASIKLAQGIHETMAGTSVLVRKSNNHFGIKCKANWSGPSVSHDDDARGECFRKYESPVDSYRDHSNFLKNSSRYASLFRLDPLDYAGWANGLKKAGYATNPKYPQIIIKLIKDYNLQDYTLIAMGKMQPKDEVYASNVNRDEKLMPQSAVLLSDEGNIGEAGVNQDQLTPAYPQGEFKINETKVVFAKKGTSYFSIATSNNISLARLFEFNDLEEAEELERDQLIFLQKKRRTGAVDFHLVRAGESLYDIAQSEGIRLESLLELNEMQPEMKPLAGSKIYLRTKAPSGPNQSLLASGGSNTNEGSDLAMRSTSAREVIYTVKAKETIYSISKKHQVTVGQLVEWNRLKSHTLRIGQQLKIYK